MIHAIRRYFYKNKYPILGIGAFIVLILVIIQLINGILARDRIENDPSDENIYNVQEKETILEDKNAYITNEKSLITGQKINSEKKYNAEETINKFIEYCNNKKIEEAYNLLSEDCKLEVYSSIEKFKADYIDYVFAGDTKKVGTIENWNGNIFKISIKEDIMATGKINDYSKQDYITLVQENNSYKLNINGFIRKEIINKEIEYERLTFKIISKSIYFEYEEYNIQVLNANMATVLLDTQNNPDSIYIQDENNIKYYAFANEIPVALLKISPNASTALTIQFNRTYTISRKITSLTFSDVILNYNGAGNKSAEIIKINL